MINVKELLAEDGFRKAIAQSHELVCYFHLHAIPSKQSHAIPVSSIREGEMLKCLIKVTMHKNGDITIKTSQGFIRIWKIKDL